MPERFGVRQRTESRAPCRQKCAKICDECGVNEFSNECEWHGYFFGM